MKLRSILIEGVGGLRTISLPALDEQMNILCGPNGIGKTTVLESIAHCFTQGQSHILKRNVNLSTAHINATLMTGETIDFAFDVYDPSKPIQLSNGVARAKALLSLKTTRTFGYQQLNAVGKDTEKQDWTMAQEAISGVQLSDIKNWFVNRHMFSPHEGALNETQKANFELAKKCFSALNGAFEFSHVDASSLEIAVDTPDGKIHYEYLSSGFKSCLSILFGIIKEVEFRFPGVKVEDFAGIVLLDEIELHLHPEWQGKIASVLTKIFPRIQFIVTTHSPHVIQAALPKQVIALELNEGAVRVRPQPMSALGYRGWTVDEVLTDVMGMADTRSEFFNSLNQRFTDALDKGDRALAEAAYSELSQSLHPNNPQAKLMRIQMASAEWSDA